MLLFVAILSLEYNNSIIRFCAYLLRFLKILRQLDRIIEQALVLFKRAVYVGEFYFSRTPFCMVF